MYIEINWKRDMDSQEEYDYHELIVKSFKSILEYELSYENSRFPHDTLRFQYHKEVGKFQETEIPLSCKITFDTVKESSSKLRQYWL